MSDIVSDKDLILMVYETPGAVSHSISDAAKLQTLVELARTSPGSLERVVSRLASVGVRWEPIINDSVCPTLQIDNVEARWAACVDLHRVAQYMTEMLSAVDVDASKTQSPWWVAAQAAPQIPKSVLPVIRAGVTYALMRREAADVVEAWAAALPGWYEDQPLIIRDVSTEEILGQNSGDSMSNQQPVPLAVQARIKHIAKLMAAKRSKKTDNPDYKFYVVDVKSNKVYSGWEYAEDAKDAAKETKEEGKDVKVMSRRTCVTKGCDPTDEASWGSSSPAPKKAVKAEYDCESSGCEGDMECRHCGCEMEVDEPVEPEPKAADKPVKASPSMSKEDVLAALKAGQPLSTTMLPVVGMTMEHFLRYAQLSDEKAAEFDKKLIEQLEKQTGKASATAEDETMCPMCSGLPKATGAAGKRAFFTCPDCDMKLEKVRGEKSRFTSVGGDIPLSNPRSTQAKTAVRSTNEYSSVAHKTEVDFNKVSVSLQEDVKRQDASDSVIKKGHYRLSQRKDKPELVAVYTKYDQHVGDAMVSDLKKAGVDLSKAGISAKVVKAEAPDSIVNVSENKQFLKKLNKLIKMGLVSATEIHGAVMQSLRMAGVSPRVADAAADKVREALFLTEEETTEVEAKVIDAGDVTDFQKSRKNR